MSRPAVREDVLPGGDVVLVAGTAADGLSVVAEPWVAEALARTELFGACDRSVLEDLAVAAAVERRAAGERLFSVGDHGDALYVIVEGAVAFSVVNTRGEQVRLAERRAPETFGELALFQGGGARTATADVTEDALLISVDRGRLLALLEHQPAAVEAMLCAVGGLVDRLTKQFAEREQRLIARVEQLQVEVDQARRERDVALLTENDEFQALRERAQRMRAARAALTARAGAGTDRER